MTKVWKSVLLGTAVCSCCLSAGCGGESPAVEAGAEDSLRYFLTAVDSIGVVDGDDEYIFGRIRGICHLANGTIVVADQTYGRIRQYSPSGRYLREVTGNGTGPGEFNTPYFIAPLGNETLLSAIGESKVMYFDSTLAFLKEASFADMPVSFRPGCPLLINAVDDSIFVGTNFFIDMKEEGIEAGTELSLWNGNNLERVIRKRTAENFNSMTYQLNSMIHSCFDPQTGRLFWADRQPDDYTINCVDFAGDSQWVFIQRQWEPVHRPDSVIEYDKEVHIQSWVEGTGSPPDFEFEVELYYPSIGGLSIGPGGRLWVQKVERERPYFEVYDTDGTFLFECETRLSDWQDYGHWMFKISRNGFLATPFDPSIAPKVYILELQAEPVPNEERN
jgi:hypothetical protein